VNHRLQQAVLSIRRSERGADHRDGCGAFPLVSARDPQHFPALGIEQDRQRQRAPGTPLRMGEALGRRLT
jgi:hypothetical protein